MADREKFTAVLHDEIEQAGAQRIRSELFHSALIVLNILLGATTTYLAAVGYKETAIVAMVAGLTTVVGTLEKTFGFGRAKSGFRKARTQFQNLENEMMKIDEADELPDQFVDKLNEIRKLKVELTDKS